MKGPFRITEEFMTFVGAAIDYCELASKGEPHRFHVGIEERTMLQTFRALKAYHESE